MTDKAVLGGEGILLQSYKQAGPEQEQEAKVTFISGSQKLGPADPPPRSGCLYSRRTGLCCLASLVVGCLLLVLGVVLLLAGRGILAALILRSMALSPGSDRTKSWLDPPVQAHLTGFGFHVLNPDEVEQGERPRLQEIGPFVYRAVTVKDSKAEPDQPDNLVFNKDGQTLTYRPRKFYFLDRAASVGDPDTTYLTVPNIPFLTGMQKIRSMEGGFLKTTAGNVITKTGLGTPFINITFSGLLWGYQDELPCRSLNRPAGCEVPGEVDIFNEEWEDEDDDDSWGDFRRRKRSVDEEAGPGAGPGVADLRNLNFSALQKPKAEIVDCKCEWGLFRDRNVTLRKPVTIRHGQGELERKGWVEQFDGSSSLGWWKPGSSCDAVGGQDGPTLPPGLDKHPLEMFISLMCRRIKLEFEKEVEHAGLVSYRFIPPVNALGSHTDPDPDRRNIGNNCFCRAEAGFDCYKSGVMNMAPCKTRPDLPLGAPIALSYPHFYQADPSYLAAVEGLAPDKERHQFYADIMPEFGFPLAIRPRFQLNAVIKRDTDIEVMSNFTEELVLPFLWAQDGFSEPSEEMAAALQFGLTAPDKLPVLGGAGLILAGGAFLLVSLVWTLLTRRAGVTFPAPPS